MQGDLQQQAKTALTEHYKDPCSTKKKMILTSWAITNISIFPFFISVVVATGLVSAEGHGGTGFSLIWTFFHTVALLIFGTYVLVKALTPVTYGMLVMACLLMGSWMLQTMVVVGQYNCVNNGTLADDFSDCLDTSSSPGAIRSTIAFGVFLFLGYIVTGIMLLVFKREMTSGDLGQDARVFLDGNSADPDDYAAGSNTSVPTGQGYNVESEEDEEEVDIQIPTQAATL